MLSLETDVRLKQLVQKHFAVQCLEWFCLGKPALFATASLVLALSVQHPLAQQLSAQERIEQFLQTSSASFIYEDKQYAIVAGSAYEIDATTGNTKFLVELYEPDYLQNNYVQQDGIIYRIAPDSGQKHPVITDFDEGFEDASSLADLIGIERGWTALTLQSAAAPTVQDYVRLRQKILRGEMDFIDNRVEPSGLLAYEGIQSLRTYAPKASGPVMLTKSSLETELLHFANGDHFWFSAMFYIEHGAPTSLVDLEADYIYNGPGMRLMVSPDMVPRLELKWADKPTYRLNMGIAAKLPMGKWFRIRMHFLLSETQDGLAELWLDDELIIRANGQTLPLSDSVLTRLEVGITANPVSQSTLVYVDQLKFSNSAPIE